MTTYTVQPLAVRGVDPNDAPPEGLTVCLEGDGVLWIHVDGLARRLDLDPWAALVVGGALLKFAVRHVALDEAEAAGSG